MASRTPRSRSCRLTLAVAGALCLSAVASPVLAEASNDRCYVEEAKEAYSEVNKGITEETRKNIEEQKPSGEQDFTSMGCIDGFGISGELGLPDLGLGSLMNPCEAVKGIVDEKLAGINEAIGNWEGPAGISAGGSIGREETGEEGALERGFQNLQDYRNSLQDRADSITSDREFERSYNPGWGGGEQKR